MQRKSKAEIERSVRDVASMLGIESLLDRKPRELSGGQRQRVAMGSAIVRHPRAFLMDEPLSNLDAKLRIQMRVELVRLHRRLGVTTIYVTHDQTEAMTLGQRVMVLNHGKIQQVAPPRELYAQPVNAFVAGFIGSPPMNFLRGRLTGDGIDLGGIRLALPPACSLGLRRARLKSRSDCARILCPRRRRPRLIAWRDARPRTLPVNPQALIRGSRRAAAPASTPTMCAKVPSGAPTCVSAAATTRAVRTDSCGT